MQEAGLYDRHPPGDPLLKRYANYLKSTMDLKNHRQEVDAVARFLYYMNPQLASMDFVKDLEKAHTYFEKLTEAKLSHQTRLNCLQRIRRFVKYNMRTTNLSLQKPDLYRACELFITVTEDLQKTLSKGLSRERVDRR